MPLFLMLSGFLLLDRTESLTTYYTKRLSKVILPLVAWTVFYVAVMEPGAGPMPQRISQALLSSLSKPAYFHLGFLYQLLAIYVALPVLRPFVRTAPRAHLWYFVGVWIIVSSVLPMLWWTSLEPGHLTVGKYLARLTGDPLPQPSDEERRLR